MNVTTHKRFSAYFMSVEVDTNDKSYKVSYPDPGQTGGSFLQPWGLRETAEHLLAAADLLDSLK